LQMPKTNVNGAGGAKRMGKDPCKRKSNRVFLKTSSTTLKEPAKKNGK